MSRFKCEDFDFVMGKTAIYDGFLQSDLDCKGYHLLNCPDFEGLGPQSFPPVLNSFIESYDALSEVFSARRPNTRDLDNWPDPTGVAGKYLQAASPAGTYTWAMPGLDDVPETFVFNETPAGAIDGVNTSFSTASGYTSGSLALYKNGIRLRPTEDYTESGFTTFTMVVAPATGDELTCDYNINGSVVIGEVVAQAKPSGQMVVFPASQRTINVCQVTLQAGAWDVGGNVNIFCNNNATHVNGAAGIGTASQTITDDGYDVASEFHYLGAGSGSAPAALVAFYGMPLPSRRINLSVPTTVYLCATVQFSGGAAGAFGYIEARRAR